ncbi:putative Transmembrane protein 151-like protein [Hypsibius exemplaris]|uniref:Transmembrane protein 151-like protein n=1 Tax=Hypsibius exemplaris TaxID=2072580 RepID=A0A1W0X647_HYPEX|nr:putative Transmembrane protein 151-like protein [Hypsibius exemplaris]
MPQTSSILIQTSPALEESTGCTASFEVLQPEVVTPKRKNFCHAIFENSNGKCILLSGAIYGFIILTIWCQLGQDTTQETGERSGSTETDINCQTYLLVPIIFASLFYISYLLENWQYYTRQEDLITISIPSTMGWIDRMRCSLPIVWWKASCYHYTVFPCRHGLNRNTDTPTTNRSSSNAAYQRIISHSGACRYNYLTHGFRDVSSVIRGLDRTPLTRIHFNKSFVFFTQTAAKEYEEQRRSFFRDCQPRDDYMEMREGMDLMDIDFPEEVIVVRDLDRVPWWRRKSTFMVAVLCLQAAPLRILLALQTATLHYNVLKVFGMDERESNWPGPRDWDHFTPTSRISFRRATRRLCCTRALPCGPGIGGAPAAANRAISQVCDFWLFQQQQRRKTQNGKNQSSRMNCRKACVPEVSTRMGTTL